MFNVTCGPGYNRVVPNPQTGGVLDAFRVEGTIGSGSMGDVFRGVDIGLNRKVAIKILSEKHRDSRELRQRFVREGRAVAAISHPNVVQVFATGSYDDRPYIAMELLDGTDLGSVVEKTGALSSLEAAHVIFDAAQGLAAAAKAGLIHRDVKPSNLVRLTDMRVKVTDFGLAKPVDPGAEPALTAMGVVVGTPDYIAPEQARGETIDERVDIYALGGTLYFLLTGIPPFRTGRPADDKYLKVVARHLRNPAPEACVTVSSVDRELSDLAKQMMAKKPADRPSYSELIARAGQIIARLDPEAVPQIVAVTRERSRPNTAPGLSGRAPTGPGALLGSQQIAPLSRPPTAPSVLPPVGSPFGHSLAAIDAEPTHYEMPVSRGVPAWLVLFTIACIAFFVIGLVIYLRRDEPAATAAPVGDATKAAEMIVVTHPDGSKWFQLDVRPVTLGEFRRVFKDHKQSGGSDAPVTSVSYDQARSYAASRGGRLVRDDEYERASTLPELVVPEGMFDWIESEPSRLSGADPMNDPPSRRIARRRGLVDHPHDTGRADVTFRVAKDI